MFFVFRPPLYHRGCVEHPPAPVRRYACIQYQPQTYHTVWWIPFAIHPQHVLVWIPAWKQLTAAPDHRGPNESTAPTLPVPVLHLLLSRLELRSRRSSLGLARLSALVLLYGYHPPFAVLSPCPKARLRVPLPVKRPKLWQQRPTRQPKGLNPRQQHPNRQPLRLPQAARDHAAR